MTMCLIYAQSVRNKVPQVPQLTECIIEHDFDIVGVTETWLHNTSDDVQIIRAMQIPGYTFIHVTRGHHSNISSRGGGVALLRKRNMKLASKSSWKAKSFENIEVTLTASSTVKLAVIYRPPPSKRNKSTVGLFVTEFQDFLEHHTVTSQNILIVGDFNFHYEDPLNVAPLVSVTFSQTTLFASMCPGQLTWLDTCLTWSSHRQQTISYQILLYLTS